MRALARVAGGGRCCDFVGLGPQDRRVFDPVAAAFDGDDLDVMEKAVKDGPGSQHIAQELSPFF